MYMTENFKAMVQEGQDLVLTRKGVAPALRIPSDILNYSGFDPNIEGNEVVLSRGDSVHVLADQFGLSHALGEVALNVFFTDNGMVLEIQESGVILKGGNGDVYIIDADGEVDYPLPTERVRMFSTTEIMENCQRIVKNQYGLTDDQEVISYTNNLLMAITVSYSSSGAGDPCFSLRVDDMFEDLGLEQFQFVNYKEQKQFFDALDEDEDEEEEVELDENGFLIEEDDFEYKMGEDDEEE